MYIQELNRKIEQALACPCIDDIKAGPCGTSFVGAFACFIKSQANIPASSLLLNMKNIPLLRRMHFMCKLKEACKLSHRTCFQGMMHAAQGKEVDCMEQFTTMQQCMGKYPEAFADVMQSMEGAIEQTQQ